MNKIKIVFSLKTLAIQIVSVLFFTINIPLCERLFFYAGKTHNQPFGGQKSLDPLEMADYVFFPHF